MSKAGNQIKQLDVAQAELEFEIYKPPRRDANKIERVIIHERKLMQAKLAQRYDKLTKRRDTTKRELAEARRREGETAMEIVKVKNKCKEWEAVLVREAKVQPSLPVVIGRSLTEVVFLERELPMFDGESRAGPEQDAKLIGKMKTHGRRPLPPHNSRRI